jgi:hypothetical protein
VDEALAGKRPGRFQQVKRAQHVGRQDFHPRHVSLDDTAGRQVKEDLRRGTLNGSRELLAPGDIHEGEREPSPELVEAPKIARGPNEGMDAGPFLEEAPDQV